MHIEQTAGRKKSLDASVNIVPYIDMLMTLMIFLMLTAVWTRYSALETQSAAGGGTCEGAACNDDSIHVVMRADALSFDGTTIDALAEHALAAQLRTLALARPHAPMDIAVDDGVAFERVAAFLDEARGAGFTSQSLHGSTD